MKLTIATFISKSESFNPVIIDLKDRLQQESIKCELVVFSDHKLAEDNKDLNVIVDGGRTKYRRIQHLLEVSSYGLILCVDNDVSVNMANFPDFIRKFATGRYVAGWGKIDAKAYPGIVPKLIGIDKKLSHNLIRPLLWKFGVGISMPGQLFLLNKTLLSDSLPLDDTVFDDLQIGIIIRKLGYNILYLPEIIGVESPKLSFIQLIKQRTRWARGYAETMIHNWNTAILFVLIHGIAYHIIWIVAWLALCILLYYHSMTLIIIFGILLLTFTNKKFASLRDILVYTFIFPPLHIIWLLTVTLNLVKLKILGHNH